MKSVSRVYLTGPLSFLFAVFVLTLAFQTEARSQVLIKPKIQKKTYIIPMPNLIIADLFEGNTPTSVYVQVGNVGSADAGPFYVRLSLQQKGSTAKTYVEKRVSGLKAKVDVPLYIEIGKPIAGLEIGVFVDARNQVKEPDEKNCGKLFPGGGVSGVEPCENF